MRFTKRNSDSDARLFRMHVTRSSRSVQTVSPTSPIPLPTNIVSRMMVLHTLSYVGFPRGL